MSKLAKKLSRQIMAFALSVAMILPNMTVYASEVSDPDSILPVSEVEADVEEPEIEPAELSLTKEETTSSYTLKDSSNGVMPLSDDGKVDEGEVNFRNNVGKTDYDGYTITNLQDDGRGHGILSAADATIALALADDKYADISVITCCYSNCGPDNAEIEAAASSDPSTTFTVVKEKINGVSGDGNGSPRFTIFKAEGDVTLSFNTGVLVHSITVTYYDKEATGSKPYKEKHLITVTNDGKGTATAASDATKSNSSAFAEEGEEVTLTATATEDGYVFDKWEVVSGGVTVDNDKFTMGTSDVVVKATFKVGEDTNYVAAGEYIFGGQVDKDKGNGTAVAVTGIETDIKYHGSGHGLQAAKGSTMKLNLSGSAEIEIVGCKEGTGLSGTVTPSKGKVLGTETVNNDNETAPKHTIWVPEAGKVTLTFGESRESYIHKIKVTYTTTEKYSVKLTNDGHGTATATPPFGVAGTEINLIATPKTGYAFKEWKPADGTTLNITDNKFTLPASDVEIQAVFEKTGPRTEWDFTNTEDTTLYNANNSFQDTATIKSGELAGLQIDATASGAKFQPLSDNAYVQVNKDTKIKVPVTDDNVKVTVQWNQPGAVYTVAGKSVTNEADQLVQTVECESAKETGSDDKYVEIVVTNKTEYLEIIKIEPIVYVASGTMTFTGGAADMEDIPGLTTVVGETGDFVYHDASHGYRTTKDGVSLELNLKEKANVTVKSCQFNNGHEMIASSGGVVLDNSVADESFIVLGAAKGPLTLTFPKSRVYIHSITVNYASDATGYEEKFAITVTNDGHGSAIANSKKAESGKKVTLSAATGDEVTLSAEAESGYKFKEWKVVEGGVTVADDKFTVGTAHVEIQAVFELSGSRFEWDFANDETLTGETNGTVVENKKEDVADLTIDATAAGSKWDSTVTDGWVVVKSGTKIEVPLDGVNAEDCEEGKYRVTVIGKTADYKVDGQAATKAGDAERFLCEGTDGKVVIEATDDNNISYIKVAPYEYIEAGTIAFNVSDTTKINKTKGLAASNEVEFHDTSHGLVAKLSEDNPTGTIELSLAKKANVSIVTCSYGVGSNGKIKASSGEISKVETTETKNGDLTGLEWTVLGAEKGDFVLTFYDYTGEMYIHNITVEYPQEILPGSRNIDVWDFAGQEVTDTETMKYNNNMTAETIKAADIIAGGVFKADGSKAFGDLTMFYNGNDRFYSTVVTDIADKDNSHEFVTVEYDDGYTSAGGFYCNGTGGESRRYITIGNVQAGDKIVAYMGLTKDSSQFFFEGTGAATGQKDEVDADTDGGISGFQKYEFVAEKTGTYKIWENAIGKPMYHRVVRVPGVAVSGTIDFGSYNVANYTVKFINNTNQKETFATLEDNNFNVILAPGFTYTAVLSGASGYGFTLESKTVTTADSEYKTGKSGIELVVETKDVYNYTGQIKGFAQDYDVADLDIQMIPPQGSNLDKVKLNIENMNFDAVLESNVAYTMQLNGVDDYEVTSDTVINKNDDYNADIEVELKPKYNVSGSFIVLDGSALPSSATVTKLTFTILDSKGNENSKYVYDATIADGGYSTRLRNGEYIAKAVINGFTTTTHVVVNNAAVEKDIMFAPTTTDTTTIDYASDIYVGYKDKPENNYTTVSAAMDACERMNRTSGQRVTVHIAPGVYREQIMVKAPNVTLVNDTPEKQVLLTWYYGIGYKYYSADSKGYYNPQNAYDKYGKRIAAKWGVAVYVQSTATAFRAEGITFENSFNRYITDEEIADGVVCDSCKFERKYGAAVESRAAIERGAAMIIEADQVEFKDCGFYSSQDTLYTAESSIHGYFKNCVIEGNTDYIYGGGDYVFDGCELSWKGYSDDTNQGGYITAARPAEGNKGYLFRNCIVTSNEGYTVNPGYFGRNWGADAKVVMLNTKLEKASLIADAGWAQMSGDPKDSNYFEYNTTTTAGVAVDTSKRVRGVIDATAAAAYTAESFFGSWTPSYYIAEAAGDVEFAADSHPTLSSNAAEGNDSKPGNILTVSYSLGAANDANDASIIQWYRVDGSTETLLKTTNASDKTYLIVEDDIGKKIKVTVTPAVSSGKTGTAESATMESEVAAGFGETVDFAVLPSITSNANINVPHPDDILTVSYSLDAANISKDASKIEWYRVKDGEEEKITENTAPNKTYKITTDDLGAVIKVYVTPINSNGTSNGDAKASSSLTNAVTDRVTAAVKEVREPYATPDPKAGAVAKGTTVKLGCNTEGASIYYNINSNDNPSAENGTLFDPETGKINITNNFIKDGHVIIKAIAVKEGWENSRVMTFDYTVSTGSSTPGGNGEGLEIILEEENYTYTGSAIIPEYTVTYNGEPLIPGIEYTVKCSNNVKVADGKAKITVTGKGNLSGNTFKTFNIKQKSLAENDESGAGVVEGDKLVVVEGAKATPILTYNGKKLAANKDFEFADPTTYKNKKDWSSEDNGNTVTVKAKEGGSFKDSRDLTIVFVSKEAQKNAKLVVKLDNATNRNIIYDGTPKEAAFTVENKGKTKTLEKGADYIVSYQSDIISAGKKTFTVTGISADCVGTVTKTYTIKPAAKDETKVKVALDGTEVSVGNTKLKFVSTGVTFAKDALEVTYDGKELEQGVDYKITYGANKKVGTAKYTVTGLGNYKGVKKTGQFTIEAAAMSEENVTVIVSDVALAKAKVYKSAPYVIENAGNTQLKASNYKVTYCSDEAGTQTLGKTDAAGTAYVKIEGKGGYTGSMVVPYGIKEVKSEAKDLGTAKIAFYDAAGAPKPAKNFSYTGEPVQPYSMKITFKDKSSVEVVLDKDATGFDSALYDKFDITFVNNTNKGKASVIVRSADDESYVGGKTATFSIAARNLKNFTWGSGSATSFFDLFK